MRHFRRWQRKALSLYSRLQTGLAGRHHRTTGSTVGSYRNGARYTYTIAFTLTIPLRARRYYNNGRLNGATYWTKWDTVGTWICGYVKTELTTVKGRAYCKLTRKEYTHQSQPICPVILRGVKINILLTETPHTTLVGGGARPGKQPIY